MTCFQFSRAAERPPVLEYWIISKYWTTGALPHCCRFMLPCLHIRLQRHVIVATRLSLYAASTAKHMRCHCPYHLYQYFSNRLQKLFFLYIFSGFEPYIVPVGNMYFFSSHLSILFSFSPNMPGSMAIIVSGRWRLTFSLQTLNAFQSILQSSLLFFKYIPGSFYRCRWRLTFSLSSDVLVGNPKCISKHLAIFFTFL